LAVHGLPSLQTVPFGCCWSAGQAVLAPVQLSAMSHEPTAARQTAPEFPAVCWQPSDRSHVSIVHGFPSSHSAADVQLEMVSVHDGPRSKSIAKPLVPTRAEPGGASKEIENVLPAVASADVVSV
jgi:hypothetical protein